MQANLKNIVCVGGGHCNVQVLKQLKAILPTLGQPVKLTLINEAPASYYSGMLPGAVSHLYSNKDITIEMAPLAKWCNAHYIQDRVQSVNANNNKLVMENGSDVDYDILVLNVGSKTRGTQTTTGVWEHSLTTRPINDLLPKIEAKEKTFIDSGVIPSVVVCGAGAAGTELAFAFKKRWSKLFNTEINTKLISASATVLKGANPTVIEETTRLLAVHNIEVLYNKKVTDINASGVTCDDGTHLECTAPIWATGASAQKVTTDSDLEIMDGYFRVNDFLQSTSHPNVFAGGDCITMETYAAEHFPPKAGVYAVREGPFIAQNIVRYLKNEELLRYEPQREFLSLMMTGDEKAIGTKFGMSWSGKWVWKMKDYIDMSFMKLFIPAYLYRDYETHGTEFPLENNELFEEENAETASVVGQLRTKVASLDPDTAAKLFICGEDEEEFHERLLTIQRMNGDAEYAAKVMERYAIHKQ